MSLEWQNGKVVNIIDETPSTRRYFIEATDLETFDFKPGQFVTLDLPIHEKKNKRWRSYSIASAPNGTNIFELVIVLVEDGLGTPFLFNNIKIGDPILFRGPAGIFVLPEIIEHDYFMICTGTGIAPFRSMIQHIHNNQLNAKDLHLIFGTRTKSDLLYFEELNKLQEKLPNFNFVPVLSREKWDGKTGYVHDIYKELCEGNPHAQFLLCGWKNMIDDAKNNLLAMGYDKKQIHFELYG
ncbi:MAG: oxidoreductase [Bacteroidetes bacterium]|jgi:ferredoxin-NADP reductase|nr:oxidoreductase [Bacteroidota bacterium]MBK9300729.1 oxidoreductase [Bacteroidota bacterium]MBK9482446.1 oxidoreductase [Bacteroidota bacterium]